VAAWFSEEAEGVGGDGGGEEITIFAEAFSAVSPW